MEIRSYQASDLDAILELFCNTVFHVNSKDYTLKQCQAWTSDIFKEKWHHRLSGHKSAVALIDGQIVGFGDIDEKGYLDCLYVHHLYQRQKIGSAICDDLEEGFSYLSTYASITARPFFESRGYVVCKENRVIKNGVSMTNYLMCKGG